MSRKHEPEFIVKCSAWPYANGPLHIGHIAALLPADSLARYHRAKGDHVLWVSGSDCHGTPITERARKEGRTPGEIAREYHEIISRTFEKAGFSYSLYWSTMEPAHHERVQASFLVLYEKGFIVEGDYVHARCEQCQAKRADREIAGICPSCRAEAKGDQCDTCGIALEPNQLIDAICTICGHALSFEVTRELFFDLPRMQAPLQEWIAAQTHWRLNARNGPAGTLAKGLRPVAITRAIDWGIPVPLPGWEDRRLYVWFEAVHGYWTASMEWALRQGNPDAWKPYWSEGAIAYYVIGKDNIRYHTLDWPAILMVHGLALPHHIVSSEYLVFEDRKLSTSKGWVLWADDVLDRYDPDFLRFFLLASGPEKQDTNFTWERFITQVNSELIDSYGNLVQRVLAFAKKKLGDTVVLSNGWDERDEALLAQTEQTFEKVGELIEQTEFRRAVDVIMELVREANRYMQECAPWAQIKLDEQRARTTIGVLMKVIASLSILTEPFMPFQARRLREMLPCMPQYPAWQMPILSAGAKLGEIKPLFEKIDPARIDEERERLEEQLKNK